MAHDFPSESLMCYTFVEQMTAGIVAPPPERVATVAAFWRERLPLAGQHKRQKKVGRRCGYVGVAGHVVYGTKAYQSPTM